MEKKESEENSRCWACMATEHVRKTCLPSKDTQVKCERLKSQNRVSTEHEADWQSWQAVSSSTGYK